MGWSTLGPRPRHRGGEEDFGDGWTRGPPNQIRKTRSWPSFGGRPTRYPGHGSQTSPFVFASPHSGRLYPASFVAESRLTPLALRRSEDAFVDELFAAVAPLGAPLIAARFPRAFVDANRAARELDRAMFDDALAMEVDAGSARVAAGLGVIPRIVRDGAEIYREQAGAARMPRSGWRVYIGLTTGRSAELVEETRTRFGVAVVVDCHSMPSAANVPDIVLGDRYGASASPGLMRFAERAFQACGFSRCAQRALCGRAYHRPLWPSRQRHPCASDRSEPGAVSGRRAHRTRRAFRGSARKACWCAGPSHCAGRQCAARQRLLHSPRNSARATGFCSDQNSSRVWTRKKAAPRGAAKFREETPRKGRGSAKKKSAMPRCNNMPARNAAIKN